MALFTKGKVEFVLAHPCQLARRAALLTLKQKAAIAGKLVSPYHEAPPCPRHPEQLVRGDEVPQRTAIHAECTFRLPVTLRSFTLCRFVY